MALQRQNLNINFAQGLDTKTDPFQVEAGRFLTLENSVFQVGNRLQKRNGFGQLTILPDSSSTYVSTFNGNLLAFGDNILAYSQGSQTWVNKGSICSTNLDVLPLIRSNLNQSQADIAIAANGLICTVYTDDVTSGATTVPSYKYAIASSVTGQNIIAPTVITPSTGTVTGSPKVFLLGRYFIIVFTNVITATNHLQYIAISTVDPTVVSANVDISASYTPATTVAFDGYVANNSLFLAWNGADVGSAVRVIRLSSSLVLSSPKIFAGHAATLMTVTADVTGNSPIIYFTFYDNATGFGYTGAVDISLNTIFNPTQDLTDTAGVIVNLTSVAQNGLCTIYTERAGSYTYDSSIATNFIRTKLITQAGVGGLARIITRSVGLASKAFIVNGAQYFLGIYSSPYQPSYFLLNEDGKVVSTLAYSNGSRYYTVGLPNVVVTDDIAQLPYFKKDSIDAVNKTQGAVSTTGVYSQLGINLATFTVDSPFLTSSEIGSNLNLPGGFLWAYDGYEMVENGFFLWPDYVETTPISTGGAMLAQQYFYVATYEWSDNQGNVFRSAPSIPVSANLAGVTPTPVTFTSVFLSGVNSITASSATGLVIGQVLTDSTTGANITAGTYITSINGTTIGLSKPTAGPSAAGPGDTLSTSMTCSVTVNIPTLRLTRKISNPVKIVLYRWSTAQQTYYQATSIQAPVLNSTSVDYIAIVDKAADSSIIGNNILYTTGGVVENIGAPACDTVGLFQSRLFLIPSEDKNLLMFSKQVIENTPVEMSDLLSIYIAPTTSAQGNTGPMRAISALDDKLILFKKNAIYYITGQGPDNTGANSQFSEPIFITATVGCENQRSIVFMPNGLMFQSDKGIWLLGRDLSTQFIGAAVEGLTDGATVLSALNIPGTNQVRFTLDTGITLMYDYFYGQWGTFTGIPSISSTLYQNLQTFVNPYSQVLQETPDRYLDVSTPVTMKFTTSWLNLAGLQGYERAYFFYLLGSYISPHKLRIEIAHDYNPSPSQTVTIAPDNYSGTWGSNPLWGSSPSWGGQPSLEQWRVFFKQQKCQAFQLTIQELFDPSVGAVAGAGLTLSGLDIVLGIKSGYPRLKAAKSVG